MNRLLYLTHWEREQAGQVRASIFFVHYCQVTHSMAVYRNKMYSIPMTSTPKSPEVKVNPIQHGDEGSRLSMFSGSKIRVCGNDHIM